MAAKLAEKYPIRNTIMETFSYYEKECEELLGKQVRITFRDGSPPMRGTCVGYTRAVDNEPEIAEIDLDTGVAGVCYGLMENEIEAIEELPE